MDTTAARRRPARLLAILVAALLVGAAVPIAGCSSGGATAEGVAPNPMMSNGGDPNVQACKLCGAAADPAVVEGSAEPVGDEQVARITIAEGVYTPTRVTASAGKPVVFEFTPSKDATGCIAMPSFESLGKKGMAKTETGRIELGTLQPGTYEFSCGMGSKGGELVVQ